MTNQVVLERREKVAKLADLGPKQISLKLKAPYSTIRNDLQVIRKAEIQPSELEKISASLQLALDQITDMVKDLEAQSARVQQAINLLK